MGISCLVSLIVIVAIFTEHMIHEDTCSVVEPGNRLPWSASSVTPQHLYRLVWFSMNILAEAACRGIMKPV